jgi:hypothetical protein
MMVSTSVIFFVLILGVLDKLEKMAAVGLLGQLQQGKMN